MFFLREWYLDRFPPQWVWNCSGLCRLQMLADGGVWYIFGILEGFYWRTVPQVQIDHPCKVLGQFESHIRAKRLLVRHSATLWRPFLPLMTLAMMMMMICSTIISQTSNNSSSGSRWAMAKTKTFLESDGQNLFRTVEKTWKNQTVWSQQSSKK